MVTIFHIWSEDSLNHYHACTVQDRQDVWIRAANRSQGRSPSISLFDQSWFNLGMFEERVCFSTGMRAPAELHLSVKVYNTIFPAMLGTTIVDYAESLRTLLIRTCYFSSVF